MEIFKLFQMKIQIEITQTVYLNPTAHNRSVIVKTGSQDV